MAFWQHRWNASSQFNTACQNKREKRDSVVVSNVSGIPNYARLSTSEIIINVAKKPISGKQTGLVLTLKWIFGILCALIVLIITIKICLRKAL